MPYNLNEKKNKQRNKGKNNKKCICYSFDNVIGFFVNIHSKCRYKI